MATKTTTIRLNEEEQKLVDLYMEFQDVPFTTIVKQSLFEDINDFFDSMNSEKAIQYNTENTQKYTSDELMKELGIE